MSLANPLARCLLAGESAILVEVTDVAGSAPRDAGATMLVTARDVFGTIGGGALEHRTIEDARRLLFDGQGHAATRTALGPDIGQCCGGHVRLRFQIADAALLADVEAREAADRARAPTVLLVGAGHVGRAIARALSLLPVRTVAIDEREGELARLPDGVEWRRAPLYEDEVRRAPPGAAFVVATHDHGLDFAAVHAALARGDAAYVGMIGSATKRARFARFLREVEADPALLDRLVLPIGGKTIVDKRPEVIAALVAAELVHALFGPASSGRAVGMDRPHGSG